MEKLQFLFRAESSFPSQEFVGAITQRIIPRVSQTGVSRMKFSLTDTPSPPRSIIPFAKKRIALLSMWVSPDDGPPPGEVREMAKAEGLDVWGYRVEESTPVAYERTWPEAEWTPGVGLLTIFNQRSGIDFPTFIRRWHGGHTPLTLKIHPVWNYVRNVVKETVLPETPHLDAIVEEQFRERNDLLSSIRFFGGPFWMFPNMIRVGLDIRRFIDLSSLETYFTREKHVRG
jgi:hypothetical protein